MRPAEPQELHLALYFSDPFETLVQFQDALDQLRSSNWLQASPSGSGSYPPVNVFRKGEDIVMVIEVPGVRKNDLRIEAKGNTIRIAATKTIEQPRRASIASNAAAAASTGP